MAHIHSRRDRPRLTAAVLPVQPLVLEVGEPDRAGADRELAPAILMNACARVETGRCDVGDRSPGVPPADHDAARLVRSQLGPVQVLGVPADHLVAHVHGALEEKVDRYRRSPGPERSDFTWGHWPNTPPATASITGAMRPV